jgi:hypothetical protein
MTILIRILHCYITTDGQSASLSWALRPDFLILSDTYVKVKISLLQAMKAHRVARG